MAARRRRRRANPHRRHRRHRANPSFGRIGRRIRRRFHRRRTYRRNPGRRFGLGRGRGLLAMPDLQTVAFGALGAAATPLILRKTGLAAKLPGGMGGIVVQALAGVVIGGFIGKALRKPGLGAAYALGAVMVPAAGFLASQKGFAGGDYSFPHDVVSGALYAPAGALEGVGDSDMDDVTQTPY